MRLSLALLIACLPATAFANDGWGGIASTGLTFSQTEDVAMLDEDLFIGPNEIRVAYVFANTSDHDVTGEVIFPLPPISVTDTNYSEWNLPDDHNAPDLVDFKAVVDGRPQPVTIDRIAVIEPEWDPSRPLAEQYDSPGRDVTAELASYGLPLTVDFETLQAALLALSPQQQTALKAAGLAEFEPPSDGYPASVYANWSVVLRYHWTQTFAAGTQVKIAHSYVNRSPGGLFTWAHPVDEFHLQDQARYCIDDGTSRAMAKRLATGTGDEATIMGVASNIAYVLRTANSWAGPIGHFKLTIDKGAAENIVSLCAEGLKKTGPTTFEMEKTNFTPDSDLEILVVKPMQG